MARKARVKSSTGIYHVLVRAISNLSLFTDEEDRQFYIDILNNLQSKGYCEVYAYALFPTHVHLLIREGCNETAKGLRNEQSSTKQAEPYENQNSSEAIRSNAIRSNAIRSEAFRNEVFRSDSVSYEPIGSIMKRLASAYSYYYNVKYEHYGPIYTDRFKSNPVETRDYFLKVLNHIGSQPTEARYTCHHIPSGLSDSINQKPLAINPRMLDFRPRPLRITDSRLLDYLEKEHHYTNIGEFLLRDHKDQEDVIRACKKKGGSIRQLIHLTGWSYALIYKVRVGN